MSLIKVENLSVDFGHGDKAAHVVRNISFTINAGETVALVGESGSGKSVTALSLLQLLPYPSASHPTGSITFEDKELIGAAPSVLQKIRGNRIAMIFQEPMTSLNPLHTIEKQVAEVLTLHKRLDEKQARAKVIELLNLVALPNVETRLTAYPHELSGGQRQRVMIAMALANEPDLLIADEPTTALDVTIQAQILELLRDLQKRMGMAVLMITHDLGVVRKIADKVCVMQKGEIVEQAPAKELFSNPQHPYTKMLLAAEPKGANWTIQTNAEEILTASDVKVYFPIKKGLLRRTVDYVRAVDGISLTLHKGETIGVVGESGSGKTTLGLGILRLLPSEGRIVFCGGDITTRTIKELRPLRQSMQIVFQDPFGSLSPRMTIGDIIAEGLDIHKLCKDDAEREQRVMDVLQEVGLDPAMRNRYPHEFSGGQRQRISIARAVILKPKFIVLDEPTSALDMSVQAQIIDLLRGLQQKYGLAYMFISHDLRVIRALAHYVIVMKNGKAVEQGATADIFTAPKMDYTKALMAAALNYEVRKH